MNKKFKRLNKPRVIKFTPELIGHSLPERTKDDSGVVGKYIDALVRQWAGQKHLSNEGVDLDDYGIEIKSQGKDSTSDWTIGNMTCQDIVDTDYVNSSLYTKLQSLLLVKYDNSLRVITEMSLYYLDNDITQQLLENAYEAGREKLRSYVTDCMYTRDNALFDFGDDDNIDIRFSGSQQFIGVSGFKFEYANSGSSFKFRITQKAMKKILGTTILENHAMFEKN